MEKKHECPPEGAPEWMATYGDLVTLLLCFFILLFSMATLEKTKFEDLTVNLKKTLGLLPFNETVMISVTKSLPDSKVAKSINLVATEGDDQSQTVVDPKDVIVIGHAIMFEKGSAVLQADQYSRLHRVALQLRGTTQVIEIHGYCSPNPDDDPIKYNDKWELAFYRTVSVIEFLTDPELGKISKERLRIYVHGEYDFRSTQLFTSNRAERQRVEIILSPSKSSAVKDTEEAK